MADKVTEKVLEKAKKEPAKVVAKKSEGSTKPAAKTPKAAMLTYKGRSLVRSGNEIYYGDMAERAVVRMEIRGTADFSDLKLPNKVRVFLLSTDEDLNPIERIKNNTEKNSLADAIETAAIWLDMELGH